ncbi:MAG: hypothetical protein Q7O66_03770, partial [Dehalococcoidia bacterium]|nr:hypothetical protein [Dehalococcoidia bacterium]
MTRIDDLQKKCPGIPREVIVKLEALRCGIADAAALSELGRWIPSVGPHATYNYDHDETPKESAAGESSTVRPGYTKYLGLFHTRNGLGVEIQKDSKSPYQIGKLDSGQFAIYEGEEKVEDIYFPHIPWPFDERPAPTTSKGTPATRLVNLKSPNCFDIVPVRFCEYFPLGEECTFCNFNAVADDARSVGVGRPVSINLEETAEAFKLLSSE